MSETLSRVIHSDRFHQFITAVILFAAVLVGVETYPSMVARYGPLLHALDWIVLAIFVVEILMKMGAARVLHLRRRERVPVRKERPVSLR